MSSSGWHHSDDIHTSLARRAFCWVGDGRWGVVDKETDCGHYTTRRVARPFDTMARLCAAEHMTRLVLLCMLLSQCSGAGTYVNIANHGKATKDDMLYTLTEAISEASNAVESGVYTSAKANAKYDVDQYTLTYTSNKVQYTALVSVPSGNKAGGFDTVVFNHEEVAADELVVPYVDKTGSQTSVVKGFVPTTSKLCSGDWYFSKSFATNCVSSVQQALCCNFMTSYAARASLWATQGFIVIMPDYAGMGKGAGSTPTKVPPAYQKSTYAGAIVDALDVFYGDEVQGLVPVKKSTRLLVGGFDEGGYATMAVLKTLDTNPPRGLRLVAAFPQSFPYVFKTYAEDLTARFLDNTTVYESTPEKWRAIRLLLAGTSRAAAYDEESKLFEGGATAYTTVRDTLVTKTCLDPVCSSTISAVDPSAYFKSSMRTKLKDKAWPDDLTAAVVSENTLSVDWKPKARTFFCSSLTDRMVPASHTQQAKIDLEKQGGTVIWDTPTTMTADAHFEANVQCYLIMTSLLQSTDWAEVEDEIINGIPEDTDFAKVEPFPIWAIVFIAIGGFFIALIIVLRLACKLGPCDAWVLLLSKCALVVLILGFLLCFAISAVGLVASKGTITVDSNFAGYMTADSELKQEQDVYGVAQGLQSETTATAAKSRRRLTLQDERALSHEDRGRRLGLTRQSLQRWKMEIFYSAKKTTEKHGIFYKEALEEIKDFEKRLRSFPGYKDFCLMQVYDPGKECDFPTSVVNIMFGRKGDDGNGTSTAKYDGEGPLREETIEPTLKDLATEGAFYYTDANFGPTNLTSMFTRSQFKGGLPVKGQTSLTTLSAQEQLHKDWLKKLYREFLLVEGPKLKHVTVTWYETWFLRDYEVEDKLWHDAKYSAGSFMFVFLFTLLHLESFFLAYVAMTSIILSFPMAYMIFYVVAEIKSMMLLNFVSLFLIMGIGADDVFVMFDTYKQSFAVLGEKSTLRQRMLWAYKEAGGAMLITTVTTVGSFYSNCLSTVRVVKEFGLFMGTVVAFNFINCMMLFPAALVVHESVCGKKGKCGQTRIFEIGNNIFGLCCLVAGSVYYAMTNLIPLSAFWGLCAIPMVWRLKNNFQDCCCQKRKESVSVVPSPAPSAPEDTGSSRAARRRWRKAKRAQKMLSAFKNATAMRRTNLTESLDPTKLQSTEKFFYYQYSNCLHKLRYVIILFGVGIAVFSGYMATVTVKTSAGPPVVFLEEHNLGRIEHLMRTAFSATSVEEMDKLEAAFPAGKEIKKPTCPGRIEDQNTKQVQFCSGENNGACNTETLLCTCTENFVGLDCAVAIQKATLKTRGADQLKYEFEFDFPDGSSQVQKETKSFTFENDGDAALKWLLKFKEGKPSWIKSTTPAFPTPVGELAKRSFATGSPVTSTQEVSIEVEVDNSVPRGQVNSAIILLESPIGTTKEILVSMTKKQLVPSASVMAYTKKDGSDEVLTVNSVTEVESRLNTVVVSTAMIDELDEAELYVGNTKVAWTTNEGTKKQYTYNGISLNEGETQELKIKITRTFESGTTKSEEFTYFIKRKPTKAPGAPTIISTTATAPGEVAIGLRKPTDDGGADLTLYKCISSPGGIEGQSVTSATASEGTVTVTGLTATTEYQFNCLVRNAASKESPETLLMPATEKIVANDIAPTITGAPVAEKKSASRVDITTLPFTPGGAILKSIECTSSENNIQSSATLPVVFTGLDLANKEYTFTCTVASDNGKTSSKSGDSNTIKPAAFSKPTFSLVRGDQKIEVTSLSPNAQDGAASGYKCILKLKTGTAEEITNTTTGNTITFPGLVNGHTYSIRCSARNAQNEDGEVSDETDAIPMAVPSQVQTIKIFEPRDGGVTIQVEKPANDGGGTMTKVSCVTNPSNIQQAESSLNGADVFASGDANVLYPAGTLTNGVAYKVKCRAHNDAGAGPESSEQGRRRRLLYADEEQRRELFTTVGPPGNVENLAMVRENSGNTLGLRVTFTQSAKVTGLDLQSNECKLTGGGAEHIKNTTATSYLFDSGIAKGVAYTVSCISYNAAGVSPNPQPKTETAALVPTAQPVISSVTATAKATLEVEITAYDASNNGGLPISSYKCTSLDGDNSDQEIESKTSPTTKVVFSSLSVSKNYKFKCLVSNAQGNSAESAASSNVRPVVVPSAPTISSINRLNGGCKIVLAAPSDNGGADIDKCKCTTGSSVTESTSVNKYEMEVSSLTNDQTHAFTCQCSNTYAPTSFGAESASASVTPADPPVPTKPPSIAGVAAPSKVSITFIGDPVDTGKSAIIGYNCTAKLGTNIVATETSSSKPTAGQPIVFSGLSDGQSYSVTCQVENSEGVSPASEAVTFVPSTTPDAPTNLVPSAGRKTVTINFSPPSFNGGSPVTGYTCTVTSTSPSSSKSASSTGTATSVTVGDLVNGRQYSATCTATNSAGPGDASTASVAFTPKGKPDPPVSIVASRGGSGEAIVVFSPPVDTGGAAITEYECVASGTGDEQKETGTSSPLTITGLTNGGTYTIKCTCTSAEGISDDGSAVGTVLVATVPGQPTISSLSQTQMTQVSVVWSAQNTGGSSITEVACYGRAQTGDSTWVSVSNAVPSGTVVLTTGSDMKIGSIVRVHCHAKNIVGTGTNTTIAEVVIEGPPVAPVVIVQPQDKQVKVTANITRTQGAFQIDKVTCTLFDALNPVGGNDQTISLGGKNMAVFTFVAVNGKDYYARCYSAYTNGVLGNGASSPASNRARPGIVMSTDLSMEDKSSAGTTDARKAALKKELAAELSITESAVFVSSFVTSGGTSLVTVQIMLADATEYAAKKSEIESLPSTFFDKIGAQSSVIQNGPNMYSPEYFMNDLKSLSVEGQGALTPSFNKDHTVYTIDVPAETEQIVVKALPNDAHATFSLIKFRASDDNYEPGNAESKATVKLEKKLKQDGFTEVQIEVTPGDRSAPKAVYTIQVYRTPKVCPACQNGGTCDGFTGKCTCTPPYKGDVCETNCPTTTSSDCSGHGTCDTEKTKGCVCQSTYSGMDCTTRVCPVCFNTTTGGRGTCDTVDYSWTCKDGYEGDCCDIKTCFKNCHAAGKCNGGTCECYSGFKGEFCEIKLPKKVPMSYALELSIVFGINRAADDNKTMPVFDSRTNFESAEAMNFLESICSEARNNTALLVREEKPCWVTAFKEAMIAGGQAFPISPSLFPAMLTQFFAASAASVYKGDIGTKGKDFEGKIQWTSLTMKVNVDASGGAATLLPQHTLWKEFTESVQKRAPKSVGTVRLISKHFTQMDTEIGIITSTVVSYLTSNAICFVCVVIFTGDLLVSLYAMFSIVLIVMTLMGFLFAIMGYTFGAIEAVGVTIFVGMSVDYGLHMAHGFHGAHGKTRFEKIRDALTHLGVSIVGGAVTTAGAAIFLLFCHMFLFVQLGTMMFANTLLALFFSLVFLAAVCDVGGPLSHMFDIYAFPGFVLKLLGKGKSTSAKVEPSPQLASSSSADAGQTPQKSQQNDDDGGFV